MTLEILLYCHGIKKMKQLFCPRRLCDSKNTTRTSGSSRSLVCYIQNILEIAAFAFPASSHVRVSTSARMTIHTSSHKLIITESSAVLNNVQRETPRGRNQAWIRRIVVVFIANSTQTSSDCEFIHCLFYGGSQDSSCCMNVPQALLLPFPLMSTKPCAHPVSWCLLLLNKTNTHIYGGRCLNSSCLRVDVVGHDFSAWNVHYHILCKCRRVIKSVRII